MSDNLVHLFRRDAGEIQAQTERYFMYARFGREALALEHHETAISCAVVLHEIYETAHTEALRRLALREAAQLRLEADNARRRALAHEVA